MIPNPIFFTILIILTQNQKTVVESAKWGVEQKKVGKISANDILVKSTDYFVNFS